MTDETDRIAPLIADDAWLPEECARPDPRFYRQYLLHCDPLERLCVVSFVWGPGQRTPIHERPSVSIHVHGANIGAVRRHVFEAATGAVKDFVSGYSSATVPNLWHRSAAAAVRRGAGR